MRTASVGGGNRQKSLTKIEPAESGGAPADHLGSERDARTPFWFDNPNFCQRLLTAFSKNPRGGAGTAQMEVGSDQFYDREVQQVKSQSARLKGLRKSGPKKGGYIVGPPNSATRIKASIAACHSAITCSACERLLQQPRQIDVIILSAFASSRSMAGLVPSSGPFWGPLPTPFDESAVPNELVPGAAGLVPKAPPVTGMPPAPDE